MRLYTFVFSLLVLCHNTIERCFSQFVPFLSQRHFGGTFSISIYVRVIYGLYLCLLLIIETAFRRFDYCLLLATHDSTENNDYTTITSIRKGRTCHTYYFMIIYKLRNNCNLLRTYSCMYVQDPLYNITVDSNYGAVMYFTFITYLYL